jgi:hypothetical protein
MPLDFVLERFRYGLVRIRFKVPSLAGTPFGITTAGLLLWNFHSKYSRQIFPRCVRFVCHGAPSEHDRKFERRVTKTSRLPFKSMYGLGGESWTCDGRQKNF